MNPLKWLLAYMARRAVRRGFRVPSEAEVHHAIVTFQNALRTRHDR